MNIELYPLLFDPIFKERIWGGEKLKTILNKSISSKNIGESWELSAIDGFVSVVSNGHFKGKSLNDLIEEYPKEILGEKVFEKFGKKFPLLFKYLDAHQDLSIQVHPNDELAMKRHNSFGKTEMWYVLQADNDAKIIVGFKESSNPSEYIENQKNKTLDSILNAVHPKTGDVFFLETGTIHAIGSGLLVAEIQQTSDITYRIYDFDRKDADGNERELHNELALEAINYDKIESQKNYSKIENISNSVINCQYFTTNFIPLNGTIHVNKSKDSFTVYMCVDGFLEMEYNNHKMKYKKGDTILIPAIVNSIIISGKASILEIYIS